MSGTSYGYKNTSGTFVAFRGDSTATYTYAANSTGGTVDLGARNNYRYVNASNVYAKGKADGTTTSNFDFLDWQLKWAAGDAFYIYKKSSSKYPRKLQYNIERNSSASGSVIALFAYGADQWISLNIGEGELDISSYGAAITSIKIVDSNVFFKKLIFEE